MSRQSILLISPFPPLPNTGAGVAIFSDLTELQKRGSTIDLICFRSNRSVDSLDPVRRLCRHLILIEGPSSWTFQIMYDALWKQRPLVVSRHDSLEMQHRITQQLTTVRYDVVLVEFSFMFQYLKSDLNFAQEKRPLFVLDHRVVTPNVYRYFKQVTQNPILKFLRTYEIFRLKQYLQNVLCFADRNLFTGKEDLDYVRREFTVTDEKLVYRPTGLVLDRYPVADPESVEPYSIGFFGAYDWQANVDAVIYFVNDILPLIVQKMPQVRFVLAGRAAPKRIRALAHHPHIEFVGEVDDMFEIAQRVAVIVVPLRIGAGTRLKILEAMAWGKPIVATTIGVEGVDHIDGEDILVRDTPESFVEATVALLNDPIQQRKLAQGARRRIENDYTTQRSVDRLQQAISVTST